MPWKRGILTLHGDPEPVYSVQATSTSDSPPVPEIQPQPDLLFGAFQLIAPLCLDRLALDFDPLANKNIVSMMKGMYDSPASHLLKESPIVTSFTR